MRRFLAACLVPGLALPASALAQEVPPDVAPPPGVLLAQVDDSDLQDEETLEQLKEDEYEKGSWSVGKAVALSALPGAGFGLVYTEKKAQAAVPFVLSAAGYAIAGLYMAGIFNESSSQVCKHKPTGAALDEESVKQVVTGEVRSELPCSVGNMPGFNQAVDPRSASGQQYFNTKDDYETVKVGEDFDGFDTGVLIAVSTYIGTTLIGAVWSSLEVMDHNEQLRKDIESTVQGPLAPTPVVAYDGEQGLFGLAWRF